MNFEQLKKDALQEWEMLHRSDVPSIFVCKNTDGSSSGLLDYLEQYVKDRNLSLNLVETGSLGISYLEPVLYVNKPGFPLVFYKRVTPEIVSRIFDDYINGNNPGDDISFCKMGEGDISGIPEFAELPFNKLQVRIALRNCGFIDPLNINHYIAREGYSGLERALNMTQDEVIEEIDKSNLRGRGGAGFPAGMKWKVCRESAGEEKYLICNCAGGDPQSENIKFLLENDPHSVLEGMLIAAYAAGAGKGYLFINAEYKQVRQVIEAAINQMNEKGLLGQKILGSDFNFNIEIRDGAGALICGEETALILSMEGKRAMPLPRPPYPAFKGFKGQPTLINNAETLADVSVIMGKGADWFTRYGTPENSGTKIFTLGGKVARRGIIEVPLNTTLRQAVFEIGGGITGGNELKALHVGGAGGGILTETSIDTAMDFDSLRNCGADISSGSIEAVDNEECIVDYVRNIMDFNRAESCGECVSCREGTAQVTEFLTDITEGKAKPEDIELLLELGETLKLTSLCGLGKGAANPVLTGINNFRDEFTTHISRKRCPAKVCPALVSFHIMPNRCEGCMECIKVCPSQAIKGGEKLIHIIDQQKCTKCGKCLEVCPSEYEAVSKVSGRIPPAPEEPVPVGSWEPD